MAIVPSHYLVPKDITIAINKKHLKIIFNNNNKNKKNKKYHTHKYSKLSPSVEPGDACHGFVGALALQWWSADTAAAGVRASRPQGAGSALESATKKKT